MPKRPTDEHDAVAKRARTETHAAPVSARQEDPDVARGLQLLLDAYMKEKTGHTVSLTTLVDLFGGAASPSPRAGAAGGGKSGIDSSPPSESTRDGRKNSEGRKSSTPACKSESAGSGAKKHQCLKCNKSFKDTGYLKIHDRVHTGEKPHSCHLCLRDFSHSSNLKRHEHTHDRK